MDDYDHSCERKLLSSHSTFGLPPVKSDSSLVDDNTGVERITKAFSPPENRLAPLLGKKLFMHYESGTARDKHIEEVLKKLKGASLPFSCSVLFFPERFTCGRTYVNKFWLKISKTLHSVGTYYSTKSGRSVFRM